MATSIGETSYRSLLKELAEDLKDEEVGELLFLLRLIIKGKKIRSDIKSDATSLMTKLEELNLIGDNDLTLLVELFEIIGRNDLKDKILKTPGHSCQVSERKISKFMRTLWEFGQKLESCDLKTAIFMLGWKRYNIKNVWQMFEKAFETGDIEENDIYSIITFAEKIELKERLKSVLNAYSGNSYNPGLPLTPGDSQGKNLHTLRKEEGYSWLPDQTCPVNNLPHPSYIRDNPWQSLSKQQIYPQVSVVHEDNMSLSQSNEFRNFHMARGLPASKKGGKSEPLHLKIEPSEKFVRQDASGRQENATHLKLFVPQNIPEEVREGNRSQNEVKDEKEMVATGSSSDDMMMSLRQTSSSGIGTNGEIGIYQLSTNGAPVSRRDKEKDASKDIHIWGTYDEVKDFTGSTYGGQDTKVVTGEQSAETEPTKFRDTLKDVINVESESVQALKKGEQKEASHEIKSMDEELMSGMNISGSHDEVKDSKSIQNNVICLRDVTHPDILGAQHLINNQNELHPGIKMDITEDQKDSREISNTNQLPCIENLTISQTVKPELGSIILPVEAHTSTHNLSLDTKPKGASQIVASQIVEQIGTRKEIFSRTLSEEKMSKLNFTKEDDAHLYETRLMINDLINIEHEDIKYGQIETKIPGNVNQSNDVASKSKQDLVEQTITLDENRHVGNGRDGQRLLHASLFGPSHGRTSEKEGGYADGNKETIEGKDMNPRNQEQSQELQGLDDSLILKNSDIFRITKNQLVCSANCPRQGQIIRLSFQDMELRIGDKIGKGAFGTVYKAKMRKEEKCEFAIKKIVTRTELFQKSHDMEIHNGRILHPFVNPIVARAENLEEGVCYLMYPYMKNRDLRHNINIVNVDKRNLCTKETNAKIWSRCIHQIVQAVDFLHSSVPPVRGSIFHRDLTSCNIFLDENFNVRIGDFGIAVEAKLNATKATLTRTLGTKGYHPPNMNQEKYNASYDVFSVGVVILEILTGLEAVLEEEDEHCYLYKKYDYEDGYTDLINDLEQRAEENKAACWNSNYRDYRDEFAKIALQAVQKDEEQRKMVDLFKRLEDMRLSSRECYNMPENQDRCVSCCVNPKAKLSTKGQECMGNKRMSPCQHFCVHCLMNHHFNPLVCPQHGKTRPPFGDHVYAVFVAGNNVKDTQKYPGRSYSSHEKKEFTQMFVTDVEKVVQVLTARHPFVLGVSKENIRIVKPGNPGTEDKMEEKIKQAFEDLNVAIEEAIRKENLDPKKERLPSSLFIFYFSGHCSKDKGLCLGSTRETLKASADWIQEMLNKKLGVDQILVVLDCCHANSQNFTDTHGVKAVDGRRKASIVQLSSCDENDTSSAKFEEEGSYFTHYFCHGLLGLDSVSLEDDKVMFCNECQKHRTDHNAVDINLPCGKYYNQCLSDHIVPFYALKNYIHGHFQQKKNSTSGPECITPVSNSQGEKEFYLAYYNPFKRLIPIHLKGLEKPCYFCLNSDTDSIDKLRQNIMKHSIEKKLSSDVLKFHESYEGTPQDSSHLIAIHPKYSSDRCTELTSLDDIYKARSCSHELVAKVRDNVKAISNGPVKLSKKINSTLVINSGLKTNDHLDICQSYIRVDIKTLKKVEDHLSDMKKSSSQSHKNTIQEVWKVLHTIRTYNSGELFEKEKENVLKIYLFKEFSILEIEAK